MKVNISFILKFAGVAALLAAAFYGHLSARLLIGAGLAAYAVGYYFARFRQS